MAEAQVDAGEEGPDLIESRAANEHRIGDRRSSGDPKRNVPRRHAARTSSTSQFCAVARFSNALGSPATTPAVRLPSLGPGESRRYRPDRNPWPRGAPGYRGYALVPTGREDGVLDGPVGEVEPDLVRDNPGEPEAIGSGISPDDVPAVPIARPDVPNLAGCDQVIEDP
jgi:hypothetical protein